jgi:predicted RNA-binding Zn-ribbon protein involved in translation (DUF1610 family)
VPPQLELATAAAANVHDETGQSTYCPRCGGRVIGRDWHEITEWRLGPDGRCGACDTAIPGLFERQPGMWGRRRLPIRIGDQRGGRTSTLTRNCVATVVS